MKTPKGYTKHDGSGVPKGLQPGDLIYLQFGDGTLYDDTMPDGIVAFFVNDRRNCFVWDDKKSADSIIAYKVVNR